MQALYARALCWPRTKPSSWGGIRLDEIQFGESFASSKMIATRRSTIDKFLRAYRRGVTDYTEALLRKDRKFQAYRRHQVARSCNNHCPACLSRSWNQRRSCGRGKRLLYRSTSATRWRRHRPPDRLAQAQGRVDKPSAHALSLIRVSSGIGIFPQRRISLLPASPGPETIL